MPWGGAFGKCVNLKGAYVTDGADSGGETFKDCTNLVSARVTYAGSGIFHGCTNLKRVYIADADKSAYPRRGDALAARRHV